MRHIAFVLAAIFIFGMSGCTCSSEPAAPCVPGSCLYGQRCIDGRCQDVDSDGGLDTGPDGAGSCIDNDDDGYGEGAGCLGPDCDDNDETQTGVETCDGQDNDCDGEIDEGVLGPCGDCDFDCVSFPSGVGTDFPFDLTENDNEGVTLDGEGAIVLDSHSVDTGFIWVANTGGGQVVKIDIDTFEEVGRYVTGSDPSRTSVNSAGDVYVGNRGGQSLTKVSVLGEGCPDTNGDTVITTSAGGGDVLPAGQDDCVLWTADLSGFGVVRAVAAHDEFGPDGELFPYVWVGSWNGEIWKLDGNTGEVLFRTRSPVAPYGFALDAAGNLWVGTNSRTIGRVDTNRCRDEVSCNVDICAGESPECDAAVKQTIPLPTNGYGITVDFMQRVWVAGSAIMRYDLTQPIGSRWSQASPGFHCQGVGADGEGFVFAACEGNSRIVRVDANDPSSWVILTTHPNRGIGIDSEGKIWGINRRNDMGTANVITPGATIDDNEIQLGVGPVLSSPYTYSDMTGLQLRLATNPHGYYRAVYEGCPEPTETEWSDLIWEAETPEGTNILIRVYTADTRDGLETADGHLIAEVPPDESPVDVGQALIDEGIEVGRFLMVEFILQAERTSISEVITPRILSIEQQFICPTIID